MIRSIVRAIGRRWLPGCLALVATLLLGFLFVPGVPFTFAAQGRIILGPMPEHARRQQTERVMSDRVLTNALGTEAPDTRDLDRLRAAVRASREAGSPVIEITATDTRRGRAKDRVNEIGRAFENAASRLSQEESKRVLDVVDEALRGQTIEEERLESRLHGAAPRGAAPGAGPEERATAEKLAELERTLATHRIEAEALRVRLAVLTERVDRGDVDPAGPVDTTESDRIARELAQAERREEEVRRSRGESDPELAGLTAQVRLLKAEREEAARLEGLENRFAPMRTLLGQARSASERRDVLLRATTEIEPQIVALRARLTALRGTDPRPQTPPAAPRNRTELEASLATVRATAADLRALRARLASEQELTRDPVERFEPAPDARLMGAAILYILLAGLVVGIGVALGFEAWTPTIRTDHDIRRYVNLPLLGIVPVARPEEDRLLLQAGDRSPILEVFNTVATLVESRAKEDASKVFAVSSAVPEEGKSTVACNLAVALAGGGAHVLLIDADLRRATQHRLLSTASEPGLSTYLLGMTDDIDSTMIQTQVENLFLIPSGQLLEAPHPFLRSERFRTLLPDLRERFDYVILDLPPVRSAADGLLVAPLVDGVILVVAAAETGKDDATAAKRLIRSARGKLIGCVLNKATVRSRGYYYYATATAAD